MEPNPNTNGTVLTDPATELPVKEPEVTPEPQKEPEPTPAVKPDVEPEPIKYELTGPEGMELDQSALELAMPMFQKYNIPQEDAQQLTNIAAGLLQKQATELQNAQVTSWNEQVERWQDATKADEEIGGENFDANLAIAKQGLAKVGSPELTALLANGLGNHPAVVKAFYRVGKMLAEDSFVTGEGPGAKDKSAAEILYGEK